jgi:NADH-quinone oxidoreductase subunit C
LDRARSLLGDRVRSFHAHRGDETLVVDAKTIVETLTALRDDAALRFDFLVDLTVVDYLGREAPPERFEVVYHLRSMATGARLRVKALVDEGADGSNPTIHSVSGLWAGANWFEREAWDLYGVKFIDHPDLRRILMYEEFVGYPLRKDYPKEKRQPLVRRDPLDT